MCFKYLFINWSQNFLRNNQNLFCAAQNSMACRSEQVKRTENESEIDFGSPLRPLDYCKRFSNAYDKRYGHEQIAHQNKLPVNLFHSAAQYNKMLITNGRSVKKNSEPQIEGFIDSLQFINDPIFQSCEQRRESFKKKTHPQTSDRKQVQSFTQECCCCCCDQFCQFCAQQTSENKREKMKKKLTQDELKTALEKVKARSKRASHKKKNKKIITSKTAINSHPQINFAGKAIQSNSEKQCSSSYLSHKSFNIDHLIYSSLIKFEEKKREIKLQKLQQNQRLSEKKNILKRFQEDVRLKNRESLSKSKSRIKSGKSIKSNPAKIRMEYWSAMKDQIAESLKKDKIEGSIKAKSLEKHQNSAIVCVHKPSLSPEMIETLKLKHEQQAFKRIAEQERQRKERKNKINRELKKLEKHQKKQLQSCKKKQFKPSEEMIENAFAKN